MEKTLAIYLEKRETLKQKYAREREILLVPVRLNKDQEIQLGLCDGISKSFGNGALFTRNIVGN